MDDQDSLCNNNNGWVNIIIIQHLLHNFIGEGCIKHDDDDDDDDHYHLQIKNLLISFWNISSCH